jgi:hypothetical protein
MGRPSKRTPEIVAKICDSLSIGLSNAKAATRAGVRDATLQEWLRDPEFQAQVEAAMAEKEAVMLGKVLGGKQGWQSAAWWLERRDNRWARPEIALQINQLLAQNEKAAITTIWTEQNKAIWDKCSGDIEFTELPWEKDFRAPEQTVAELPPSSAPEPPDLSHLGPKAREAEMRKYYAGAPSQPVKVEPGMQAYARGVHTHGADVGAVGEQLRQMTGSQFEPGLRITAVKPSFPPREGYNSNGEISMIDWED